MKQTERNIKAYKEALPHLKERIAAVAVLLAMSIAMMTSATFAWLTISRAPEVSGVSTSLAANGNLEIALVGPEGLKPGESQVGDSSAAEGQSVAAANLTWGNLVNLSDPSYGLDNLTLRPARLNTAALLTSPLYGAMYGEDGRITQMNDSFGYATWKESYVNEFGVTIPGSFVVTPGYGVRAIASTTTEASEANARYLGMVSSANRANMLAADAYAKLAKNNAYMQTLATLMGHYMTARMNDDTAINNPTVAIEDLQNLRDMYGEFIKCFSKEAEAIAYLLELQEFLTTPDNTYTDWTEAMVYSTSATQLKTLGLTVSGIDQFLKDWKTIESDYEELAKLCESGTSLTWKDSGINTIVNNLVIVGTCTISNSENPTPLSINNVGASAAMNYLGKDNQAKITNGILYNFEERVGGYLEVENLEIRVTVKRMGITLRDQKVSADISTSASRDYNLFTNDLTYTKSLNTGEFSGGTQVAEDTYGLAIDFWVRTNAAASYLTLEGNVLYVYHDEQATTLDPNGNEVNVYTATVTTTGEDGESVSQTLDLYQVLMDITTWHAVSDGSQVYEELMEANPVPKTDASGNPVTTEKNGQTYPVYTVNMASLDANGDVVLDSNGNVLLTESDVYKVATEDAVTWYSAENHTRIDASSLDGEPILKIVEIATVVGYEGENRVWDNNSGLTVDATTQGSGSCYVYYADTPEDQARSLHLLEAFNVAFVGEDGKLLTTAVMDTEHFYAENGRVVVPLVLSPADSISLGVDYTGETTYAITPLEKNVATRITAIVFLDGTKLTNEEVLAASEIQGQLNIQFGSSEALIPIENEDLASQIRKVSASVDITAFDYDTHEGDMTTRVSVAVQGDAPSSMTGFFMRAISTTQGSREEKMTFTQEADGQWVADYTFDVPGTYILRSVQLDGQDYSLANPPTVTITGFAVKSLACDQAHDGFINVLSAANSSNVDLRLQFATNDSSKLPTVVQGRFLKTDGTGTVNVNFTYDTNSGYWTGTGTFNSSGTYVMEYLVLDDNYQELDEGFHLTAQVVLGMKVSIYTTSPQKFLYKGENMADNEKNLAIQVKITDNEGNTLPGLADAKLTYGMKGSAVKTMDTDLTWNGTYYIGELHTTGPGIWQFSKVVVGSNIVTVAQTSPDFTVQPPEPPSYYAHYTAENQYSPSNTAVMTAQLYHTSAAAVRATIVNLATGESFTSVGDIVSTDSTTAITNWKFPVPKVGNSQEGKWQLTTLEVYDAFDASGNEYTEDAPLVLDVSDANNVTKVVTQVHVSFPVDNSYNFGREGGTATGAITGTFMQSYTISGLSVNVTDFEGMPVSGVTDVKLTFTYQNSSSKDYGGYSSDTLDNSTDGATITVHLTDNGDGTYSQKTDATILYAGKYTTSFQYTVAGSAPVTVTDKTKMPNLPEFTVWSVKPTVVIASIAPIGSHTTAVASGNTLQQKTVTSSFSGNTATVYCKATVSSSTSCGNITYSAEIDTYPRVVLKLSGYGFASSARLQFSGTEDQVYMYEGEGSNQTSVYAWSADNSECTRYFGIYQDGTCSSGSLTVAGTLKANQLVLTDADGNEFQVAIDTITINNPAS